MCINIYIYEVNMAKYFKIWHLYSGYIVNVLVLYCLLFRVLEIFHEKKILNSKFKNDAQPFKKGASFISIFYLDDYNNNSSHIMKTCSYATHCFKLILI